MRSFFFLLLLTPLFAKGYYAPENRSQAINILKMVHLDYKTAWLSGCGYGYDVTSCMDKTIVETKSCGLKENNVTIKWMQVVDANFYTSKMVCATPKGCVSEFTGKPFGGRLCCRMTDEKYRRIQADLYNYLPVVSTLDDVRRGKRFAKVNHPVQTVAGVRVGKRFIEPKAEQKGDIARIYLYMNAQYELGLSPQAVQMYEKWDKTDVVDEKECALEKVYEKILKRPNPFVKRGCQGLSKSK